MCRRTLSLYETLTQHVSGELHLPQISEPTPIVLSVLDNVQRILNSRAGTLSHLPDYGLPDMSDILQGMPGSAHSLMATLSQTLLTYEPRLIGVAVTLLPEILPGQLEYHLDVELDGVGVVTFGTTLTEEGKVLIRHLKHPQALARLSD